MAGEPVGEHPGYLHVDVQRRVGDVVGARGVLGPGKAGLGTGELRCGAHGGQSFASQPRFVDDRDVSVDQGEHATVGQRRGSQTWTCSAAW
jgi:hypothetical protein